MILITVPQPFDSTLYVKVDFESNEASVDFSSWVLTNDKRSAILFGSEIFGKDLLAEVQKQYPDAEFTEE